MNDIILSPCTAGDISDLIAIATKAYMEHYSHLWHDQGATYIARNFSERTFLEDMRDPHVALFMLYYQGHLSGFLKLNYNAPLAGYSAGESVELKHLYLVKEATGKGVGKQVVNFVLQQARQKLQRVVWLKAMDSNSKVFSFYKQAGFELCGSAVLDQPLLKDACKGMLILKLDMQSSEKKSTLLIKSSREVSKKEPCFE